jgi:hypothetical protein
MTIGLSENRGDFEIHTVCMFRKTLNVNLQFYVDDFMANNSTNWLESYDIYDPRYARS